MALFILAATDSPIKQADTIMLTYPLNWNVSGDIMKNDLEMYETVTNDQSPAMTWSWFAIGWKWVNDRNKMNSYFLKSYQDYLIQPFKVSLRSSLQGRFLHTSIMSVVIKRHSCPLRAVLTFCPHRFGERFLAISY